MYIPLSHIFPQLNFHVNYLKSISIIAPVSASIALALPDLFPMAGHYFNSLHSNTVDAVNRRVDQNFGAADRAPIMTSSLSKQQANN